VQVRGKWEMEGGGGKGERREERRKRRIENSK
jgi:hypothetical protein